MEDYNTAAGGGFFKQADEARPRAVLNVDEGFENSTKSSVFPGGVGSLRHQLFGVNALPEGQHGEAMEVQMDQVPLFPSPPPPIPGKRGRKSRSDAQCTFKDCSKTPTYGPPGGIAVRCANHRIEGQLNLKHPKCENPECTKVPSYGQPDRQARFCAEHRKFSTVNVRHTSCAEPTCSRTPTYNWRTIQNAAFAPLPEAAAIFATWAAPGSVAA
ncbi:unnamed protein product [Phaeothamnion confervicola]